MIEPKDFVLEDGDTLPKCWHRFGAVVVFQQKLSVRDLRSLAKWCDEAALYKEWVDSEALKTSIASANTAQSSKAKSLISRLKSGLKLSLGAAIFVALFPRLFTDWTALITTLAIY